MVERLPAHHHCSECGTAIGPKEEYCSKECERKHDERVQQKKKQLLYLYLGGAVMFGLAMLLLLGRA